MIITGAVLQNKKFSEGSRILWFCRHVNWTLDLKVKFQIKGITSKRSFLI